MPDEIKDSYAEIKFHKDFKVNYELILKRCRFIQSERILYSYGDIIKSEINFRNQFEENNVKINKRQVGRIDLLIRYRSCNYCVEIKYYPYKGGEFWDAIKVLGYTEYLNFIDKPSTPYKPAIMMPKDKIELETLIIAHRLKITLFAITQTGKSYKVELVDDNFKVKY